MAQLTYHFVNGETVEAGSDRTSGDEVKELMAKLGMGRSPMVGGPTPAASTAIEVAIGAGRIAVAPISSIAYIEVADDQ